MDIFHKKLLKTIEICEEELRNRKNGLLGESTEEELEKTILPELFQLLERVNSKQFPPKSQRYLNSFACAFTIWGWNMQKPTELFILLTELNNDYKKI